jgi:uncharacterized damage-inducible protein DinB
VDRPVGDAAALGAAVIEEARRRLVKGFPDQVRDCLERLEDAQVWWRPHPDGNAVGNLVLHVCGSSRHFLGHVAGGRSYTRDRKAEFAERGPITRADLFRLVDDTVDETASVLDALDPARLLDVRDVPPEAPHTVLALVVRTSHHWAVHTGQIVFATKQLTGGGLGELWMKTML